MAGAEQTIDKPLCYLRLSTKYRSLSLPTCANPGMFTGGLIGESKHETLGAVLAPAKPFALSRLAITGRVASFATEEGIAILELNGAASETTSAYDSSRSLREAHRILFQQWDLVFAIGDENRRRASRGLVGEDSFGMAALSGMQPLSPFGGLSNVQRKLSSPRGRFCLGNEPGREALASIRIAARGV